MANIKTFGVPFVKIIGTSLRQWESGRKIQVVPGSNMEVTRLDFAHKDSTNALGVVPKTEDGLIVADIPNILLQSDQDIIVYAVNVDGSKTETINECVLTVKKRPKPDDYVYTETEALLYTHILHRMEQLEENGISDEAIERAVDKYLGANPFDETDPTVPEWAKQPEKPEYTAEEVGALAEADLQNAVNTALAQAKASGEFSGEPGQPGEPGKNGTSVTVSSVSESTVDGGTNVVTFSDGKKLNIRNGSQGSPGTPGYTPVKGKDYFDGEPGQPGYSPVKGTDYWTADDKAGIVSDVLKALPTWEGGSY